MNKTRPNRVYFRVTNEELEQIDKCVKESGMTRQDWILSVVTPRLTGGDTENKEVATLLTDPQPNVKLCPECGAAMQIKNGRRGKTWQISCNLPDMSHACYPSESTVLNYARFYALEVHAPACTG